MPHDLCGEMFVGMRTPAWHKLGIIKPDNEQITTIEAVRLGKMNFKYHALPIGITLPDGTFVPSSKEKAIFREPIDHDPEWRNLGIVSEGYHFLQNEELAAGLDAIAEQTGWKFETAGVLGQGETIFACLKTGKHSVHGDEMDSYLLITDGKAANRALRIVDTTIRAVCKNTLIRALTESAMNFTIPHSAGVENEYKDWLGLIAGLIKSQDDTLAELRAMGDAKITDGIAKDIFLAAFPEPVANPRVKLAKSSQTMQVSDEIKEKAKDKTASAVMAYEYNMRQSLKWREASFELYQRFNDGNEQGGAMSGAARKKLAGTAYAALQAVTEICDWGGTNRETVASSALFGGRATQKARAWEAALNFADLVEVAIGSGK